MPIFTEIILAEVKGRMFGTWIDEGGRSNTYNANDLIEDPAFIIESILRDELGLASADIDTASFDAAANSMVRARLHINSDNEGDALSFIRQITEQSTFAFTVSGVSKPRLINLDASSPTIARTLDLADIGGDVKSLEISKNARIINDLKIKHRFMEEYGDYQSYANYTDTTSQSDLGIFTQEFEWPNITLRIGDTAADIYEVAQLIKDKWAVQRATIRVACPGIRNSDLEVGDWIRLDPTTINPHILCYGASWSGLNFLISRVRHTPVSTMIEAINLA